MCVCGMLVLFAVMIGIIVTSVDDVVVVVVVFVWIYNIYLMAT